MGKIDYDKKIDQLFVRMLNLDNDFAELVRDYYQSRPNEKGKKSTDFYQRITAMVGEFERRADNLRQNLKNPEGIKGYTTKK